jgi:hypothetical protein
MTLSFAGDFCGSTLQQKKGETWETVWTSGATGCSFHLTILRPNQTARFRFSLPENLQSGTYRITLPPPFVGRTNEVLEQPPLVTSLFAIP